MQIPLAYSVFNLTPTSQWCCPDNLHYQNVKLVRCTALDLHKFPKDQTMPPLLCPRDNTESFMEGKFSHPETVWAVLGQKWVLGGEQPADKGWATGVFRRCWVPFTLKLPQSRFIGILRKRQEGRAPLNSPPRQREGSLNGSGGDEFWVNVKWGDGGGRQQKRFHMHDPFTTSFFTLPILVCV